MGTAKPALICTIALLSIAIAAFAENAADVAKLPGASIKVVDATKQADLIIVATIDKLSDSAVLALGQSIFTAQISAKKVLKGREQSKPLSVAIIVDVSASKKSDWETPPKVEESYVFFLTSDADSHVTFVKMLNATDEMIASVSKLVAAGGGATQKGP